MTYIAMLRGINVGGHKIVSMADLVKLFEAEKFRNVRTYVQSGNVVFEAPAAASDALAAKLEERLRKKLGFSVPVVIRTKDELDRIVSANPLAKKREIDKEKLHVTFLATKPEAALAAELDLPTSKGELFLVKGREVYLYCPNGYGTSKLNNTAFEKKLKVAATTRNWKTTRALLELSRHEPE